MCEVKVSSCDNNGRGALAGVVSAKSLWGTYMGNDVVLLTIDGKQTQISDVPAMSYNGRTMIPIYLLQQAGINYTWNNSTKTVDIKKPLPVVSSTNDQNSRVAAIEDIQILYQVVSTYDEALLQDRLIDNKSGKILQLVYLSRNSNYTEAKFLHSYYQYKDEIKNAKEIVDNLESKASNATKLLSRYNMTSDFDSIISQVKEAYDKLSDGLEDARKYYYSRNIDDDDKAIDEAVAASDLGLSLAKKAYAGRDKYSALILNFK